ncbi:MAG: class I SAM-dependent methyltransferase [Saprospiraceae bacterium]|nr:class I SAM-dependent methyltransferase [Saprospiraceae bacterium]
MSLKHLLPTFRNRFRFILRSVEDHCKAKKCNNILNLGTGEGDYDRDLSQFAHVVTACDINPNDIENAKSINQDVSEIRYEVKDALDTGYPAGQFDIIVCTEVIEHVENSKLLLREISRLIASNGIVFMTYPRLKFPISYDPVNYLWHKLGNKTPIINQGAYAFGHKQLIDDEIFLSMASDCGLQVQDSIPLSGYLIGFLEMYWTGIFQYHFKSNRSNEMGVSKNPLTIVPKTSKIPYLSKFTDLIIWLDRSLFNSKKHSIGMGVILTKAKIIS